MTTNDPVSEQADKDEAENIVGSMILGQFGLQECLELLAKQVASARQIAYEDAAQRADDAADQCLNDGFGESAEALRNFAAELRKP